MIQKVGLVFAMEVEARAAITQLGLQPEGLLAADLPMPFFSGTHEGTQIAVVLAGQDSRFAVDNVGTNAAVLATYLLIQRFKPDLIVNAGTAGGFHGRGMRIGDVFLGQGVVRFHDRRTPVLKYGDYSEGKYPLHSVSNLQKALGLRFANVSTGNSLDCSPEDLSRLTANESDLKDMEAAAVGWVCWMTQVPFITLKSVTDYIEEAESVGAQFLANYQMAIEKLTVELVRVVRFVSSKEVSEL